MEIEFYILDDDTLQEKYLIEGYESFIWTDRYNTYGDFEIKIPSTSVNRNHFRMDTMLSCNQSERVMYVDTITDSIDDNGNRMLDITGKSMEALTDDRPIVNGALYPSSTEVPLVFNTLSNYTAAKALDVLFSICCYNGGITGHDQLPFLNTDAYTVDMPGSIPFPTDIVAYTVDKTSTYKNLTALSATYNLGWRLARRVNAEGNPLLNFEIYSGDDHTSGQSVRPAVIFADDMGNLTDKNILESNSDYKSVAFVQAQNDVAIVYDPNSGLTDDDVTGFAFKAIYVDATDVDDAKGAALTSELQTRGLQALLNQNKVYIFDGTTPEYGGYVYGTDYKLGDMVEEQDESGARSTLYVTEHIYSVDDTGVKSYPTLSVSSSIMAGTWASWNKTQAWADVPTADEWGTI